MLVKFIEGKKIKIKSLGIVDGNCSERHWDFRDQAWFLSKK